ncbi:hypothetical protein [Knoellia koreensis]|uniref:DUF308 domain-containing protein n=1 Tax=Knoellia koreensis TaxID=2730921 RepID=A0A849HJ33_9MICO|nr:hypothetical protein [Knoellia sp. DB2414S]NNM46574.1 hypothetical protein [Knoellia sp. DB2414S]
MTTNNTPEPGTPDHSQKDATESIDATHTDAGSTERTEPLDTQLLGAREDEDATSTHDDDATTWAPAQIPVQHNASGSMGDDSATETQTHEPVIAPVPERPTGPHLPPLLLGVICLAVAGLALWQELADVSIDWGNVGPLGIVVVGAVLVVLGLIGLLGNRRRSTT